METIHILFRINSQKDTHFINMIWQWQLNQNPMEKRILIVLFNDLNQFFLADTLRKIDRLTMEASFLAARSLLRT